MTDDQLEDLNRENQLLREENARLRESLGLGEVPSKTQQYAGRLHRLHDDKRVVIVYDYVDETHPMLARMWEKRLRGYRAMGYRVE